MAVNSTSIKVPVSTLQDAVLKLQTYADESNDLFDKIKNSMGRMESAGDWKGESLTAAVEATQKNEEKFREAVNELNELASFLEEFVNSMVEKDAEIQKSITAIS